MLVMVMLSMFLLLLLLVLFIRMRKCDTNLVTSIHIGVSLHVYWNIKCGGYGEYNHSAVPTMTTIGHGRGDLHE